MAAPHPITVPVTALVVLLAGARTPDGPRPPASPALVCREVEGQIDARAARLGIDLRGLKVTGAGSIHGALEGGLRLEVRREGRTGPDTEIAVHITAETAAGPLRMRGTAIAARERPEHPFHRVRGALDVSAASAPGAIGRVRVEGTADTETRVIAIRYRGELCGAAGIQLAAAQGSAP
jgi:hypothetical protein